LLTKTGYTYLRKPAASFFSLRFETTIQRDPSRPRVIGLHSGVAVSIRILPAPVSTGIVFLRTDLDNFPIAASWRHVARVSYATSLMRQGVLISTTEHLLSVFYSMGIDNALRRDRQPGSAHPRWQRPALRGTDPRGRHPAVRRKRKYLRIRRPVFVEERGKRISILPAESFLPDLRDRLSGTRWPDKSLEMELTPERYAAEIAPARTFGFGTSWTRCATWA
jgi:UDP-3-O-[3-hydroxymyristoyl] N-acetylglucosamine deacetylase